MNLTFLALAGFKPGSSRVQAGSSRFKPGCGPCGEGQGHAKERAKEGARESRSPSPHAPPPLTLPLPSRSPTESESWRSMED